ncbi:uncharacterized protein LOC143857208 [Tasmannia lanceolata]|uniref:uncharacterized protein LOC143857208 n=1 Tax=Tasmannia lanceolata TaxID=3420 RepID=UPI0040630973
MGFFPLQQDSFSNINILDFFSGKERASYGFNKQKRKSSSSSPSLSFAVSVVLPAKNPLRLKPHPVKEAELFLRSHPCTLQSHLVRSKRYCPLRHRMTFLFSLSYYYYSDLENVGRSVLGKFGCGGYHDPHCFTSHKSWVFLTGSIQSSTVSNAGENLVNSTFCSHFCWSHSEHFQ